MLGNDFIDHNTTDLLQLADASILMSTIARLTPEQKRSQVFKNLGQQRYLSALRAGSIDNAEVTKTAFSLDPFFLKSKIVTDAAEYGFLLKIRDGQLDVAQKIKSIMGIVGDLPLPSTDTSAK